jgi:hypothetical protein
MAHHIWVTRTKGDPRRVTPIMGHKSDPPWVTKWVGDGLFFFLNIMIIIIFYL